jgi:hypothetical protein
MVAENVGADCDDKQQEYAQEQPLHSIPVPIDIEGRLGSRTSA